MDHRQLVFAERSSSAAARVEIPPISVGERRHDDRHLLLWQVRGEGAYRLDGTPWQMSAGHALWVPASTSHYMAVRKNSVVLRYFFWLDEISTTLSEPWLVAVVGDLRTLLLAYSQRDASLLQEHLNLSAEILALIETLPSLPIALPLPKTASAVSVAEQLRRNPGDERSITELARAVHTSTRTLERAFPAETGMTLRQWRITNRMEAAGSLLRRHLQISAVAQRVGYNNVSAFGRAFKSYFGLTPGEYATKFGRQR